MPSLKKKFLTNLSYLVCHFPKAIAITSILLALLSGIAAFFFLQFDTDQDNLISNKKTYHQRYKSFLNQFGDTEYIFVVFDVPDGKSEQVKKALLSLVQKIQSRKDLFVEIQYQVDLEVFKERALLLLPRETSKSLTRNLTRWAPDINRIAVLNSYADVLDFAAEKLFLPTSTLKKNAEDLESGFELLADLLDRMDNPDETKKFSQQDLFHPLIGQKFYQDPDGFFFSPDGNLLFLKILPVKDYATMQVVDEPLAHLRQKLTETLTEFPGLTAGVTGRPVLQFDEMSAAGSDSVWAGLGAFFGVSILFMVFFKQGRRPLLSLASLLCGLFWSVGLITITLGHLNLLSVVFAIILIGLGIDYGIHFIFRYQSERLRGSSISQAVGQTIQTSASAIITGALSSSVAFLSALFTDFLGLKELGFIAGTGVILCLVSQVVTLPAFLILWDRSKQNDKSLQPPQFEWLDGMLGRPKTILALVILATLVGLPMIHHVHFENNLLKLQDPNLESVRYEHRIIDSAIQSSWIAAFVLPSKNKLQYYENEISKLKSVSSTESIHSVMPVDQEARIHKLASIKDLLNLQPTKETPQLNPHTLLQSLERFKGGLERVQNLAFEANALDAVETIDRLLDRANNLENQIKNGSKTVLNRIQQSQTLFFNFLNETVSQLVKNLSPTPLAEDDLPPSVKKRYLSSLGNYVLYIYPKEDVWETQFMNEFISEVRLVDPTVTGSAVQFFESAWRMIHGFYLVGLLTLIFVLVILRIDLGNMRDTLIAGLPLISGILWLVMLMGFFSIDLSLANFFALPILIGIGIDNGIHLVHRYQETKSIKDMLHRVSPAIILSTLTTMIGFGALSLVSHRGLASFGQIMTLGSLSCLVASLLVVPLVLKVGLGTRR